jgi:hypothetical protein
MKWKLVAFICILTLIFASGCKGTEMSSIEEQSSVQSSKLTLDIVKNLSKKGDKLAWEDFQAYDSKDIGSGLYIKSYPIDDKYELVIGGGSLTKSPMYINLYNKATNKFIDIRHEDVKKFIK